MSVPALSPAAAIELAHGICSRASLESGVRVLVIKGETLSRHGLRSPRLSADVDVLCDPDGIERFALALEAFGWSERPASERYRHTAWHARTYWHSDWPCDIDVHRAFPGFLRSEHEVFELLWQAKATQRMGGVDIDVPDRPTSAVLMALHCLRATQHDLRAKSELDALRDVLVVDRDFLTVFVETARSLGAVRPLGQFLSTMGVDVRSDTPALAGDEVARYRRWVQRTEGGGSATAMGLDYLITVPWAVKPAALWSLLWPPAGEIRADRLEAGLLKARMGRLARGAREISRAVVGVARARWGLTRPRRHGQQPW